jgi:hypothetical protein
MADLTTLEEKLGEVTGLAAAAQETAKKVLSLLEDDDPDLSGTLEKMRAEGEETERRCEAVAGAIDGKKTAILEKAQETKNEGVEMMRTYLGEDSDALDGFEFLIMAEAGEAGHWAILAKVNEKAGDEDLRTLTEWALPLQEAHLETARQGSLELASEEDPGS